MLCLSVHAYKHVCIHTHIVSVCIDCDNLKYTFLWKLKGYQSCIGYVDL